MNRSSRHALASRRLDRGPWRPPVEATRRLLTVLGVLVLLFGAAPGAVAQEDESTDTVPALASFGVTAGFPSYQTVAASASLQASAVGLAVRAGYGPGAGASLGVTLRGYPPIPGVPVPVWIGAGASATAGTVVPHVALGAHVPVARRWRVDVEAGGALSRLGVERSWVPHLAVGVSYAFAVELTPSENRGASGSGGTRGAACTPRPADPALLGAALSRAERSFLNDARATYGSLYRGLRYDLDVVDRDVRDDEATIELRYEGSVIEIATGTRNEASGRATVSFRWDGCGWRTTDIDY